MDQRKSGKNCCRYFFGFSAKEESYSKSKTAGEVPGSSIDCKGLLLDEGNCFYFLTIGITKRVHTCS